MPGVAKSSYTLETPREFIVFAYFVCLYQCLSPTHRASDLIGGRSTGICVLKSPHFAYRWREPLLRKQTHLLCFPDVPKTRMKRDEFLTSDIK